MTTEQERVLKEAVKNKSNVITTYLAYEGFDDLMDFLREASKKGVGVIFAPSEGSDEG